jgi:hypothetical protein
LRESSPTLIRTGGNKVTSEKLKESNIGIELPGVPTFSEFLNKRFGNRISLGDVVDNSLYFTVPVLVDNKEVGQYSWRKESVDCFGKGILTSDNQSGVPEPYHWNQKYQGLIPDYLNCCNSERVFLSRGVQEQSTLGGMHTLFVRDDLNWDIPFY